MSRFETRAQIGYQTRWQKYQHLGKDWMANGLEGTPESSPTIETTVEPGSSGSSKARHGVSLSMSESVSVSGVISFLGVDGSVVGVTSLVDNLSLESSLWVNDVVHSSENAVRLEDGVASLRHVTVSVFWKDFDKFLD